MADVSSEDVDKAKFAFEIYDTDGAGNVDAFFLGDLLRALGLNPTQGLIEKLGGTKKKEKKTIYKHHPCNYCICKPQPEDGQKPKVLVVNTDPGAIHNIVTSMFKGEKTFSIEEFLPIFSQARKDKDTGVYEDFIECLKLYDKAENGLMVGAELSHILLSLGERLTEKEVEEVLRDCLDPEDDDGMVPYIPFLARVCEKPVPDDIKPVL